jgi:hypothetical protein
MTEPFIPADKRARRLTILLVAILALGGAGFLAYVRAEIKQHAQSKGQDRQAVVQRLNVVLTATACVGGLGFVGISIWLWRLARRIRRTDQYPPPGTKVLRDTPIRTGLAAWKVAARAELAAVLALAGAFACGYLWWLATRAIMV